VGRKAKCPYSHKGKWFGFEGRLDKVPGPTYHGDKVVGHWCPECRSLTEERQAYHPDHPAKHRRNLLLLVADYCDAQPEAGGLQPFAFPDGTLGVELQLRVPLGRKAPGDGRTSCPDCTPDMGRECMLCREDYSLVANVDLLATFQGRLYILDEKTTSLPLNDYYFSQYRINMQTQLYDLILSLLPLPPGLQAGGVAIRAWQVTKDGPQGSRTVLLTRTEGQREEFLRHLHIRLDENERYAASGDYPMRQGCDCPHPEICDMDPSFRQRSLEADFVRRGWSPIAREGGRK
jgi:hypothetical protein